MLSAIRLRQILLRLNKGLSERSIAKDLKIGRNQLRALKRVIEKMPESIGILLELPDTTALQLVEKAKYNGEKENEHNSDNQQDNLKRTDNVRQLYILDRMSYYSEELKRTGVTLQVLYGEYLKEVTKPYSYSFFCRIIKRNLKKQKKVYHRKYNPGEHLLIDFAGDCLNYSDPENGEIIKTVTLVCTLAYSNYTYHRISR